MNILLKLANRNLTGYLYPEQAEGILALWDRIGKDKLDQDEVVAYTHLRTLLDSWYTNG